MLPRATMGRAALLAALVAPSRAYYESTCTWKSPDGTEFDLCGLQSSLDYSFRNQHMGDSQHDSYHASHGGRNYHQNTWQHESYTYWVNVGKEVDLPSLSNRHKECAGKASAAAYQVHKESPHDCIAIGSSKATSWALIDSQNPAAGVRMIYGAGESCQKKVDTKKIGKDGKEETVATWEATPRKTILEFACDVTQTDDYASIINMGMGVSIEEKSMCEYTLQWKTRLACPKHLVSHIDPVVASKAAAYAASSGTTTRSSGGGVLGWLWWVLKWLFYLYVVLCIMIVPENCFVPTSMLKKQEQFQEFLEVKTGQYFLLPFLASEPAFDLLARLIAKVKGARGGGGGLLPTRMGDLKKN